MHDGKKVGVALGVGLHWAQPMLGCLMLKRTIRLDLSELLRTDSSKMPAMLEAGYNACQNALRGSMFVR